MKRVLRLAASAALLPMTATGAAPVAAQGFEEADVAYERGDYALAFRLYTTLADQGNAVAQFNLGLMYDYGDGVPENNAKAAKWYRRAAGQGNAYAQNNLGLVYSNGEGVPQDYAEAARWYPARWYRRRRRAGQRRRPIHSRTHVQRQPWRLPKSRTRAYMVQSCRLADSGRREGESRQGGEKPGPRCCASDSGATCPSAKGGEGMAAPKGGRLSPAVFARREW